MTGSEIMQLGQTSVKKLLADDQSQ